jgi:hypothetical protein
MLSSFIKLFTLATASSELVYDATQRKEEHSKVGR